MKISLVIPNYNGGKYLLDCLKSIYAPFPTLSLAKVIHLGSLSSKNTDPGQLGQIKAFAWS